MVDNGHYYYFIAGMAVAFFGIMGVMNLWQPENRLRKILGGILVFWMVQHIVSVCFISDFYSNNRYFSRIINAFDMTATPTCCFLLVELCKPGWLTWRKVVYNELPFVILGLAFIMLDNVLWYYALVEFFVAYSITVTFFIAHFIPEYNRFLKAHFSYDENINLRWLYAVLATFIVLMLVYAACSLYDTAVGDSVYIAGSIIGWAMICYFIQRQESVLLELDPVKEEGNDDKEVWPDCEAPRNLAKLIQERFIEPQLFLNPQLKLGDMVQAIGTNRTYMSRYLNDILKTNFYDYINGLRLKYAQKLIEQSQYSIKAIAAIAGFNSYSTYRRSFIATYKQSPQEYRNNIQQINYERTAKKPI